MTTVVRLNEVILLCFCKLCRRFPFARVSHVCFARPTSLPMATVQTETYDRRDFESRGIAVRDLPMDVGKCPSKADVDWLLNLSEGHKGVIAVFCALLLAALCSLPLSC